MTKTVKYTQWPGIMACHSYHDPHLWLGYRCESGQVGMHLLLSSLLQDKRLRLFSTTEHVSRVNNYVMSCADVFAPVIAKVK